MEFLALLVGIALAGFRLYRLIAWDFILEVPRNRLLGRVEGPSYHLNEDDVTFERPHLEEFLRCPWCCGFWCVVLVYAVTEYFVSVPVPGLIVPAGSTLVGLIDKAD